MTVAILDHVENIAAIERLGVLRSLTRKARVILDPRDPDWPADFSVLEMALQFLPAPFTPPFDMTGLAVSKGFESMVLVERSAQLADKDITTVDVLLKYEHILDGPHQIIGDGRRFLYGKGRASIVDKTTNFYRPNGDMTEDRVQILVAHTYGPDELGVIGHIPDDNAFPKTVFQGGEVSIPFPQANYSVSGIITTDNPWNVVDTFIAAINETEWMGFAPLTWICSEVQFEILDVNLTTYKFNFEFQFNLDTWNPTVVFLDQRTGRPPANVEKATQPDTRGVLRLVTNQINGNPNQPAGMWNVPALTPVNFDKLFASFFEGVNPPVGG